MLVKKRFINCMDNFSPERIFGQHYPTVRENFQTSCGGQVQNAGAESPQMKVFVQSGSRTQRKILQIYISSLEDEEAGPTDFHLWGLKQELFLHKYEDRNNIKKSVFFLSFHFLEAFLHRKSNDVDLLGFSVYLHASPIHFNTVWHQGDILWHGDPSLFVGFLVSAEESTCQ